MSFRPAVPYTTVTANERVRQLHPGAFTKVAKDSPRADRYQVLLKDGETYLVASGKDWLEALTRFYEFMEAADGEEDEGARGGSGEARDNGRGVDAPGEG